MRHRMLSSIVVGGLIFGFVPADADYKFQTGEGNTPEVSIALNQSNDFRLLMVCASSDFIKKTVQMNVQIDIDEKANVSSEVAKLRAAPEGANKIMDICMNSDCKSYTWEYCDGCGGALMSSISVDRVAKIRSVRLIVPNDSATYQFLGDFDGILKKICK